MVSYKNGRWRINDVCGKVLGADGIGSFFFQNVDQKRETANVIAISDPVWGRHDPTIRGSPPPRGSQCIHHDATQGDLLLTWEKERPKQRKTRWTWMNEKENDNTRLSVIRKRSFFGIIKKKYNYWLPTNLDCLFSQMLKFFVLLRFL